MSGSQKPSSVHILTEELDRLQRKHARGAAIRLATSAGMWAFALLAFLAGDIKTGPFIGITAAVLYLALLTPPLLFAFRHIARPRFHEVFSLLATELEVIGYTAIIYFCGGIEAAYLTLIYAVPIVYVGLAAPRRHAFIVATFCAVHFNIMVGMTYFGLIPRFSIYSDFPLGWARQIMILSAVSGFFYILAYISAVTADLLRAHRDMARGQNAEITYAKEQLRHEREARAHAEKAFQESEMKYKSILGSIEDGYYEVDAGGHFILFNDSMCKMLGYSETELAGMNYRKLVPKAYVRKVFRAFNSVYRTEKPLKGFALELISRSGSKRFIEASVSLKRNSGILPVGFQGVARDVTERKVVEEFNQRLEAQLQHTRRMEAISTLAGGIAHDFNNLLAAIVGNVDLAKDDLDPGGEPHKRLSDAEEGCMRARDLTHQFLTLAKGGAPLRKTGSIARLVQDSTSLALAGSNVECEFSLPDDLWLVEFDESGMRQVINHLVTNANEAMPKGGTLAVHAENILIEKNAANSGLPMQNGAFVKLSIRDQGWG